MLLIFNNFSLQVKLGYLGTYCNNARGLIYVFVKCYMKYITIQCKNVPNFVETDSKTFLISGLPNEVYVLWQQYPWIFGDALCKIRALVSEM